MTRSFTKLGLSCLIALCCFSIQQQVVAQCGAGQTEVTLEIFSGNSFEEEIAWELLDGSSVTVDDVSCDTYGVNQTDSNNYCLNDGETYTFNMYDSFGDGWGSSATATLSLTATGCAIATFTNPSGTVNGDVAGNPLVTGCTSQSATPDLEATFSFDPAAPINGCMDPTANNYNACATVDDGSCSYDLCADAVTIECGDVLSGTTTGAANDGVASCGVSNSAPDVWYHFVGTGGSVTASLCNAANFDTKIGVFEGTCGTLVCVGGNDDGPGCSGFTSEFTFTSVLGTNYYILVHGFNSETGDFDLSLDCEGCTNSAASNYSPTATVDDGSCEACTDPTAHNYVAGISIDDGSCETCTDSILNGDEIGIDCGGALCPPCPCGIQVNSEILVAESGCGVGTSNRVVLVTFTGGIPPITYAPSSSYPVFITQKGAGIYQVSGNGSWSIEASDPASCMQIASSDDMPYISDQSSSNETAISATDGTATVEASGGTPPYTVDWSNGATGTIAASGGSHTISGLAKGNYEAVVADANGDIAKACVYVGRDSTTGSGRGGRGGRGKISPEILSDLMAQPNPFSNRTMIRFGLAEATHATVSVFALNGEQINTLFYGQTQEGQVYNMELNASNMPSGIYILRLTTENGIVQHQRIVVAK